MSFRLERVAGIVVKARVVVVVDAIKSAIPSIGRTRSFIVSDILELGRNEDGARE